jgi:hypothetical protein
MGHKEAVAEGSRRWNELVAEGRRLVKQEGEARFALGDRALEIAPMGDDGVRNGSTEKLWRYAQEIDVEPATLQEYRRIAHAWPATRRLVASVSWSAHQVLAGHKDRFELIQPKMTVRGAQIALGWQPSAGARSDLLSDEHRQQQANDAIQGLSPKQKAAVASDLLNEPEVADHVARDHGARHTMREATDRYDTEHQERARQDYELREPRSVQIGVNADGQNALVKARVLMEDVCEAADKMSAYHWPDNSREVWEVLLLRVQAGVEVALSKVRGEDLDEELQALLKGGDA